MVLWKNNVVFGPKFLLARWGCQKFSPINSMTAIGSMVSDQRGTAGSVLGISFPWLIWIKTMVWREKALASSHSIPPLEVFCLPCSGKIWSPPAYVPFLQAFQERNMPHGKGERPTPSLLDCCSPIVKHMPRQWVWTHSIFWTVKTWKVLFRLHFH